MVGASKEQGTINNPQENTLVPNIKGKPLGAEGLFHTQIMVQIQPLMPKVKDQEDKMVIQSK